MKTYADKHWATTRIALCLLIGIVFLAVDIPVAGTLFVIIYMALAIYVVTKRINS